MTEVMGWGQELGLPAPLTGRREPGGQQKPGGIKLIIQIPCFNEADALPTTIAALPRQIAGVESIEYLIIDDGSSDRTSEIARALGIHHIIRHRGNRGLAAAFRSGVDACLAAGADIIVNTDADNQYCADDIADLVQPILDERADVVIGDRNVGSNAHFGWFKQRLQILGSTIVRSLSRVKVDDAVSGFRAMSKEAAIRTTITTDFSYTTEMLIQAGRKRLAVVSVPIRTNGPMRPSRLFNSIPHFIASTGTTILRAYAMYNPLRIFIQFGGLLSLAGLLPILRFIYFYMNGEGDGHIQSVVVGAGLLTLGIIAMMFGVLADLVAANRKLLEQLTERMRRVINSGDAEQPGPDESSGIPPVPQAEMVKK